MIKKSEEDNKLLHKCEVIVNYMTIGITTVLKLFSKSTKGRLPSFKPILNSEEFIVFKKSRRYLEFIAITNASSKPVL